MDEGLHETEESLKVNLKNASHEIGPSTLELNRNLSTVRSSTMVCKDAAVEKTDCKQRSTSVYVQTPSVGTPSTLEKENRGDFVISGLTHSAISVSECHAVSERATHTKEEGPDHRTEVGGMSPRAEDPNNDDAEVRRKAKEGGVVDVVFLGHVTKETACRFVTEILEYVLYQRQQLPMPYNQLKYHYKQEQGSTQEVDIVGWRPPRPVSGLDLRKCHRTLQDLEEVLSHLELLFALTLVPQVLLILGGSLLLPKELYEINMEQLALGSGDGCLRTSSCLRKLFRTLFVSEILTDARPVHLLTTTVMALGHRDCGVTGFKPKLDFKVPTRVKRQVIHLSGQPLVVESALSHPIHLEDYVWFQAPVAIKGFCK